MLTTKLRQSFEKPPNCGACGTQRPTSAREVKTMSNSNCSLFGNFSKHLGANPPDPQQKLLMWIDRLLTGSEDGCSACLSSDRLTLMRKTVPSVTLAPVASRAFQHLLDVRSPHLNADLESVLSTVRVNQVQWGVVSRTDPLVTTLEVDLDDWTSGTANDDGSRSGDVVDWIGFTWKHGQAFFIWPCPWPWPCWCH